MKAKNVIVFDIGGTYFRFNIFNGKKLLLGETEMNKILSPNFKTYPNFSKNELTRLLIKYIADSVKKIEKQYPKLKIDCMGISFAGPVDKNGLIRFAPTLWGNIVKDFPLKEKLEKLFPYKIYVLNDVSAACWYYKNKIKTGRFCLITVSSGIGNKIFDFNHKDRIITLDNGFGGEIGHAFMIGDRDIICDCGLIGHLGAICSGRGTEQFAKKYSKNNFKKFKNSILFRLANGDFKKINNFNLVVAIKNKDKFVAEIIKETSQYLALMIQQIYLTIGVDKFIITGGFALAIGENYRKILIDNLKNIGIWGYQRNNINKLIMMGEKHDNINLKGIGEYSLFNLSN